MSHVSNNYFAKTMNSHVDIARHSDSRYVALASHYSDNAFNCANYNSENYMQKLMSNMNALNFNISSNIQHEPRCTSGAEQAHIPMNIYQC